MKVRFRPGLRLPGFICPFCQTDDNTGTVFRERYEWRVKLSCGHHKTLGFILPFEELERRGIINYEYQDPRIESRKAQMIREKELELKEIQDHITIKLTRSRGKKYI